MRGLVTAVRTLTILPVPGKDTRLFASSLPWFPWVGLLIAGCLLLLGMLWGLLLGGAWPMGGAALILTAGVLLTRGLHLDGLADWADAIGAHRGREHRLEVMKDHHLGTFGVLALIIVLLLKWTALVRLLSSGTLFWLLPLGAVSRDMMVDLTVSLPYARAGEGLARPFTDGASSRHRRLAHGATLAVCLIFGPAGLALFFAAWITTRGLGRSFDLRFGGITGDLLGTTNETVETVLLLLCALPGPRLLSFSGWGWLLG